MLSGVRLIFSNSHPRDTVANSRGGHTVRVRELVDALGRVGHEVLLVEAGGADDPGSAAGRYDQIRNWLPSAVMTPVRDAAMIIQNRRYEARLSAAVDEWHPDALIETQHTFTLSGLHVAQQRRLPLVVDDFTPISEDEQWYDVAMLRTARKVRARLLRDANVVAVAGSATYRELSRSVPGSRLLLLENASGISNSVPLDRAELGVEPGDLVLAYVGSFQPFHRLDLLVQALASLRADLRWRLFLVGDGNGRSETEQAIAEAGLGSRTVFTGQLPLRGVGRYLATADVAVLPATPPYTNAMKLFDYVASGAAIVAPDQDNVRTIVGPAAQFLFSAGSVAALAAALTRAMTDPVSLSQEQRRTRERAAEGITWDDRARTLAEAIQVTLT
jgi:glycosyltransferase involved in cell wall biosynthesis